MITLIRMLRIKAKSVKYKLAFWQFIDRFMDELDQNTGGLEDALMSALAWIIQNENDGQS